MTDSCALSRPHRLALRWAAGRDIPRSSFPDRALDQLVTMGLLKETGDIEGELTFTVKGSLTLASIESGEDMSAAAKRAGVL